MCCVRVSYDRVERDPCIMDELEILNQAVGPIGIFSCKYGGDKGVK